MDQSSELTLFGKQKDSLARRLKAEEVTQHPTTAKGHKEGSLHGVFIPTCENMWGVLIFLKFYTIVGSGGLYQTIIAVLLSATVAYTTTICLSAIASSGGILSEGGPYHMISRALGPSLGATVGVVYWLGVTLLAVLESVGAKEAIELMYPIHNVVVKKVIAALMVSVCSFCVFAGSNIVTKMGSIFALIVVSTLILFYYGISVTIAEGDWKHIKNNFDFVNYEGVLKTNKVGLGSTIALFFPCFTGMLSGADRSDMLKDPAKNIRYGTFAALTLSLVMYLSFLILWSAAGDRCFLLGFSDTDACVKYLDKNEFKEVHLDGNLTQDVLKTLFKQLWLHKIACVGVLLSCVAQVLQCLMVAPRLLQAISKDQVLPILNWFSVTTDAGEPRRALLLNFVLAFGLSLVVEDLATGAMLVSLCFLICYLFLNTTVLLLTMIRTTTWRPDGIFQRRWRIHYMLVGALGLCMSFYLMIMISLLWSLVILTLSMALYVYMSLRGSQAEWGSGFDGFRYGVILRLLAGSDLSKQEKKINWRPQVLLLYCQSDNTCANNENERRLLSFVGQLRKGKGLLVATAVFESPEKTCEIKALMENERVRITEEMKKESLFGFAEVVQASSWSQGAKSVIQLSGLGGMRPNTVVFSWPSNWQCSPAKAVEFVRLAKFALDEGKALLCPKNVSALPDKSVGPTGTIDLWWFIHDGGLLILLTWLLAQHKIWRGCQVRIFVVMDEVTPQAATEAAARLENALRKKNVVPRGVTVEAVLLQEGQMITPYTYDWTIRAERKQQTRSELPVILDDLFKTEEEDLDEAGHTKQDQVVADDLWTRITGQQTTNVSTSDSTPSQHPVTLEDQLLGSIHSRCKTKRQELLKEELGISGIPQKVSGLSATPESFDRLNKVILAKSASSELVLMNLPGIWGLTEDDCLSYVAYCDRLTKGLDNVVFAHSAGHEIFSLF